MNINKYNRSDSILVISPYPTRSTIHTGGGIASYTKNTLLAIKKASPDQKIVVLANIVDESETYIENDILIIRCWDRNLSLYPNLIHQLFKFNKVNKVLFEFEFAAYGDFLTTSLIPLLLGILRLTGKSTTTVLHQVVSDLKQLAQHVGLSKKPKSLSIYNNSLHFFYKLIVELSHQVVTLEESLTEKVKAITGQSHVTTIPHGLFPKKPHQRNRAVFNLNLDPQNRYVLAFGYLSHYKGSDLIVEAFKKPIKVAGKTVKLILAGGESPTQGQKHHYRGFYKKLYDAIDNNPNIVHTGFVPETRIQNYFSASDLVVFPYRTFMSASGPLSLAAMYQRPFLVSESLANYCPNGIKTTASDFRRAIISTFKSKPEMAKLRAKSIAFTQERDFAKQGQIYLDLINQITTPESEMALAEC